MRLYYAGWRKASSSSNKPNGHGDTEAREQPALPRTRAFLQCTSIPGSLFGQEVTSLSVCSAIPERSPSAAEATGRFLPEVHPAGHAQARVPRARFPVSWTHPPGGGVGGCGSRGHCAPPRRQAVSRVARGRVCARPACTQTMSPPREHVCALLVRQRPAEERRRPPDRPAGWSPRLPAASGGRRLTPGGLGPGTRPRDDSGRKSCDSSHWARVRA